ncbi:MAG: hypothetical protein RLZZ299_1315 [Pseudomonadota bacterium]
MPCSLRRSARVLFLLAGAGCANPCESVCDVLADYAEDDCGMTVTAADRDACRDAQAGEVSDARAEACEAAADPVAMREWWSCDDLRANFTAGVSAGTR